MGNAMGTVFVQFSSSEKSLVIAIFGCAQNDDNYPNQDEVEESDPRYIAFIASTTKSESAIVGGQRDILLAQAAIRIAPLQDAVDLGESTDEETAMLKQWKLYRVALNRIEQQSGYPLSVEWPVTPS